MQIFYSETIKDGNLTLPEEETIHCTKVLRKNIGDCIDIIDGSGGLYKCRIIEIGKKSCHFEIIETIENFGAHSYNLHIAIAPTKNIDRIEWFLEKSTEIGIDKISFIRCKNSERIVVKPERLEKIVVSAIKQSLKADKPTINDITPFKNLIDSIDTSNAYIGYCGCEFTKQSIKNITLKDKKQQLTIIIGPEGDFTNEEMEYAVTKGVTPLSLGESRLRTETAALYATAIISTK